MTEIIKPSHVRELNDLASACHLQAAAKGFWDEDRNPGEMIALIHSELSEMLEAVRAIDVLTHNEDGLERPRSEKIPDYTAEEEEAADVLIRLLDYAAGRRLRIGEAVAAKLEFNAGRPHRHGKAF